MAKSKFVTLVNWLITGAVVYAIYASFQDEALHDKVKTTPGEQQMPLVPDDARIPFLNGPEAEKTVDAPAKDALEKVPDKQTLPASSPEKPPAKE